VVELVDTQDLGSCAFGCEGSSPSFGTGRHRPGVHLASLPWTVRYLQSLSHELGVGGVGVVGGGLDPGHLAFFVLDAVDQFDLSRFEAKYRRDGRGGVAYAPKVMVRLLLFAYCSDPSEIAATS
jgi:hypothetical protein